MTKKSKCLSCGMVFKSQTLKKKHKKQYPNASCKEVMKMEEQEQEVAEEESKEEVKELEILKEIPKIKMPKEQAKEEWKKYCEVLKKRKEKFLRIMKDAHYQMKEGRELIDVYVIMKKTGLNENNEPKLAIARADLREVIFEKRDSGTGAFEMDRNYNLKDDVILPQNTFKIHWDRQGGDEVWRINKKRIKTKVPIVPIELLPDGNLKGYYVLWETSEWEELPETKDPILLKRISENLFAILGTWDLTELEQSIIRGME